jgi:nitrogen fixation-related uncharacterized protein
MKLTKDTVFTFAIICLLIIIAFLWWSGDTKIVTDNTAKYQDSIKQRDSINYLLIKEIQQGRLKYDSVTTENDNLWKTNKKLRKELNQKDTNLPKLTDTAQVQKFEENFNFGNLYLTSAMVSTQSCYNANQLQYQYYKQTELIENQDSLLNGYQYKDSICLVERVKSDSIHKNDSLNNSNLRSIIYEADKNYQVELKRIKKQRNWAIVLGTLGWIVFGVK